MSYRSIAQLFDLSGKGAIVTGGAMGIGQGIAFRLSEAGSAVMVADVSLEAANSTAEEINSRGGKALAIRADVGLLADAEKVVEVTVEAFGSLDILVNNAGITTIPPMTALQLTEDAWDRLFDINLKGMFFYSKAAARQMIHVGRGGRIVNISSVSALRPTPGMAQYNASKGGVVSLTQSLALEFAPYNILVNVIAPGNITTPQGKAYIKAGGNAGTNLSDVPLGRWGKPDDIAKAALFLASEASDYMTGSLIVVDGGYLLK